MKGKALVVDDDPSILRALELCLALEGLEVATAPDGDLEVVLGRLTLRRRLELNPQRPFPGAPRERLRPLLRGSAPGLAALLAGMGGAE
jgi:Response regulator containing CheY-like receiver, AAA-type ATPase, and DNA-binding domains